MRAGGTARGAGPFEGAAGVRGKRAMLAKCWFRAAIVTAVAISRDCGMRGGGRSRPKWGLHGAWAPLESVISLEDGEAR